MGPPKTNKRLGDISSRYGMWYQPAGDGELKEDEEETKKEDGADYIGNGRTSKFTPSLGLIRL